MKHSRSHGQYKSDKEECAFCVTSRSEILEQRHCSSLLKASQHLHQCYIIPHYGMDINLTFKWCISLKILQSSSAEKYLVEAVSIVKLHDIPHMAVTYGVYFFDFQRTYYLNHYIAKNLLLSICHMENLTIHFAKTEPGKKIWFT